ncbi:hypothetical protein B0T22DRAFT_282803 [Podospora appendiculata]|uniref:Steroid 5-alpha reductase C-terminal domain-containing protein n=1 Tax=Podospora appendiculata TaxID=314037 RepID=A0AAE1C819_9PEZI|nr:hypothetical protein B0T22DRAFT_282803 [Podospora appendiculata]
MTLTQTLLHLTSFKSPLLQTLVPSVAASFAIQTAFAIPSILAESERFYDFSGSLTFLSVTALSLYLPSIRAHVARSAAGLASNVPLRTFLLSPFLRAGDGVFNWRQIVLSGAVTIWATRLGSYLFQRVIQDGKDSRFDEIKKSPVRFWGAFVIQATWVSLSIMPVIAINAVPPAAIALAAKSGSAVRLTDILGLSLYVGGLFFEVAADREKMKWVADKKAKLHDEEFLTKGLWSLSRHPNYFGESTLWTGIATAAAGVLLSPPVRAAVGLSPVAALSLCYVSPAFVTFLLLKVSGVPLSEKKYDKKYGDRKDYQEWKKNTPKFFPKLL